MNTDKHRNHKVIVRIVTKPSPHNYEIFCIKCKKHVQWTTQAMYNAHIALERDGQPNIVVA